VFPCRSQMIAALIRSAPAIPRHVRGPVDPWRES
jgi:hypothetical protein